MTNNLLVLRLLQHAILVEACYGSYSFGHQVIRPTDHVIVKAFIRGLRSTTWTFVHALDNPALFRSDAASPEAQ